MRPPPWAVALVGLAVAAALVYPVATEWALARFGVRVVGGALTAAGAAALALLARRRAAGSALVPVPLRAALLALPALAAATGDLRFLRLVPAAIQVLLTVVFAGSLRGGGSLLQQVARSLHPYAPDFIGPYCRKATAVFAAIFAVQGLGVAWFALAPPAAGWVFAASVLVWAPVMAASLVEWLVRKAWFRYYGPGPVDRVLRTLLPPEQTAQGRRSLEYVRRMRRELGMPPP